MQVVVKSVDSKLVDDDELQCQRMNDVKKGILNRNLFHTRSHQLLKLVIDIPDTAE